jgi:hypothetical protein
MAVLLALAACGSGGTKDEQQQAKPEAAPAATAQPAELKLRPGRWEVAVDMSGVAGKGVPPEVARMMESMEVKTATCLTPEEARQQKGELFNGNKDRNCSYSEFKMGGGTIRATQVCKEDGKGSSTVAMEGSYSADSFDLRSRIASAEAGQNMETRLTGRRVGECKGDEQG